MISFVLALLLAIGAQAQDRSAAARDAYTGCLRNFVNRSLDDRLPPDDFDTAIDGQCLEQQAALRTAVIQREIAYGGSQAQAEEDAELEIDDAKANFRDQYRGAMEPE